MSALSRFKIMGISAGISRLRCAIVNYIFTLLLFLMLVLGAGVGMSVVRGAAIFYIYVAVALLLSLLFQVRFRVAPASEESVKQLEHEVRELRGKCHATQEENQRLKYDLKHSRGNLLNLSWISEINIASFEHEDQKIFDYYKDKDKGNIGPWGRREDVQCDYNRRLIGVLKTNYTVKAGVDLASLRLVEQVDCILVTKPSVRVNGVSNVTTEWLIKLELRKAGIFEKHWEWTEFDHSFEKTDSEFWENTRIEEMKRATDLREYHGNAIQRVEEQARAKISTLIGLATGKRVEYIDEYDLEEAMELQDLIHSNSNETYALPADGDNISGDGNINAQS